MLARRARARKKGKSFAANRKRSINVMQVNKTLTQSQPAPAFQISQYLYPSNWSWKVCGGQALNAILHGKMVEA